MARSPSVSYDEDSGLSVNSSVDSANLKKEKMAAKRFQPNNRVPNGDVEMAATQRIPDSQEHVEEDEGYGPSASDDDESPSARKRQRVNEDGDDVEDPQLQTTRRIIAPLIRDPIDGFVAGSVVRVLLHNFVTYDDVEFRCGPNLNMIVGPNGSGKSSISAAIAIGLGFPPAVVKDKSTLNAYVKHGRHDGFAEIELKGMPGEPNCVIRRNLHAASNRNSFTINGKTAKIEEVMKIVNKKLNVDLHNLCSYLPQERVKDFADQDFIKLLKKTQENAGDPHLTEWHNQLIQFGKDLKKTAHSIQDQEKQRLYAKQKADALEADVAALKQRDKLQAELTSAELFYTVANYCEIIREDNAKKAEVKQQKRVVARLRESQRPMEDFLQSLRDECTSLETKRTARKKTCVKFQSNLDEAKNKVENIQEQCTGHERVLKQMKKDEEKRQAKILEYTDQLAIVEEKLRSLPDPGDEKKFDTERTDLDKASKAARRKLTDAGRNCREIAERKAELEQRKQKSEDQLARLRDQTTVREQALKNWDKDSYDALMWLRENQHRFKIPVTEPAMISVSIPDARFVQAVESCFSGVQLRTFVCHSEEDQKLLNHLINDTTTALGRTARIAVWYRPEGQLPAPPLSDEDMAKYGFEKYAIDYAKFPDGLDWYLRKELNMHRTPISVTGLRGRAEHIANIITGPGQPSSCNFITIDGQNIGYRVSRSQYGHRLPQTSSMPLRTFGNLSKSQGPTEEVDGLEREIKDIDASLASCGDPEAAAKKALDEAQGDLNRLLAALSDIDKKIKVIQEEKKKKIRLEQELDRTKVNLDRAQQPPGKEQARQVARLKASIESSIEERIQIAEGAVDHARALNQAMFEITRLELLLGHAEANRDAMTERIRDESGEMVAATEELVRLEAAKKEVAVRRKQARVAADAAIEGAEHDLQQAIRSFYTNYDQDPGEGGVPRASQHHLDKMAELRGQLELIVIKNGDAIDEYERLSREITRLDDLLDENKLAKKGIDHQMKEVKGKWEPALRALRDNVNGKFSAAFARIGCTGEVVLAEDPDYDRWELQIWVTFRDNEPLQKLSAQRQSGGERSLTTMLYLMSMTEVARSPFCLVDEINQGMDSRAEREVHDQLVAVAGSKDSGQYFVVTPKLLPALNYDERMRILCVNNGEWLDLVEDDKVGDGNLMAMLKEIRAGK